MSETMVERVAKAIFRARHPGMDADEAFGLHAAGKLRGDLRNVDMAFTLSRVAITAMREPTPEMIRAGELTLTGDVDVSGYPFACDEEAVWKAMIDAAAGKKDE